MGTLSSVLDQKTTISLESQMKRLALESNYLVNLIDNFKNLIPTLTDKLKQAYQHLSEKDEFQTSAEKAIQFYKKVQVKIPHAVFMNYTQVLVSVPEGFNGNLLDYLVFLNNLSSELYKEANQVLGGYNLVLSTFISNKQDKISLKDHTDLYQRVKKRREKLTADFEHFFKKDSTLSARRLGDVVTRFAELEQISKAVEKLAKDRGTHNLEQIANAVRESTQLLDLIITDVNAKGVSEVSGNAAMNISEGAYEVGKFVEFVALYRYQVNVAVATVEKLMEKLEQII